MISDGDDGGGGTTPPGTDPTPTPSGDADTPSGGERPGDDTVSGDTLELVGDPDAPADGEAPTDVLSGGDGGVDTGHAPAGSVRVLGAQAANLPLTGLGLPAMVVLGLLLMVNGFALRRAGCEPR